MKYALLYSHESASLARFYANRNSPVKRFLAVADARVRELEVREVPDLQEENEYVSLFTYVLMNVSETYRPDQFISVVDGRMLRVLDVDFMLYFLQCREQLTGLVAWEMIVKLNTNYGCMKVEWIVEQGNREYMFNFKRSSKFMEYATSAISLKELYNYLPKSLEV